MKTNGIITTALAFAFMVGCNHPAEDSVPQPTERTIVPQDYTIDKLYIVTDGGVPITSRDTYVGASITLNADPALRGKVKGRGNTTWMQPKKPYKIKLDAEYGFFGYPVDKEWVLLANYLDPSFLRTYAAFQMSEQLGMPYTVRTRFVELYLNGVYNGLYQMGEQVKTSASRVVTPSSNGFLLEVDAEGRAIADGDQYFYSPKLDEYSANEASTSVFVYKTPSSPTTDQKTAIETMIKGYESVLYSTTFADATIGYRSQINLESFIRWYIVSEVMANRDGAFFSSVYLYLDNNGKIALGPLWDFDLSLGGYTRYFGEEINAGKTGWIIKNSVWMDRMFDDPYFLAQLKVEWARFYLILPGLLDQVFLQAGKLYAYQQKDYALWKDTYVLPIYQNINYDQELRLLEGFLMERAAWLNLAILDL